jgi:hypothetical protein
MDDLFSRIHAMIIRIFLNLSATKTYLLIISSLAYALKDGIRRLGMKGTELARAQKLKSTTSNQ